MGESPLFLLEMLGQERSWKSVYRMRDTIFCTGIMRSASTWSYNVCRLLAENEILNRKGNVIYGYADGDDLDKIIRENVFDDGIMVLKTHFPTTEVYNMIIDMVAKNICTLRDPLDCVASRKQFVDENILTSIKNIKWCLNNVAKFKNIGNVLFVKYENIQDNPKEEIKRIAKYLCYSYDDDLIDMIHDKTTINYVKKVIGEIPERDDDEIIKEDAIGHLVDTKTLYHNNHVKDGKTGKYKEVLTSKEQRIARKRIDQSAYHRIA